jgi:hypothetical protein
MADLTAPNGAKVSVADDKVATMVRHGYQAAEKPAPKKAPAKSDSK